MNKQVILLLALGLLASLALGGCAFLRPGAGGASEANFIRGELDPEDCAVLELQCSVAEVVLGPGTRWHVEYGLYAEPEIKQENGTFSFRETGDSTKWQNLMKDSERRPYLTVTIPADKLDQVTVETAVGDVKICNLDFGALTVQADTGDLHLEGLILDSLKAETGVGSGKYRDLSVAAAADVKTAVGDLRLENVSAGETMTLASQIGDVRGEQLSSPDLSASCDTGEVKLKGVDAQRITAESGTGGVELTLPGSAADYAMELQSDLGGVEVDDGKQSSPYVTEGGAKTLRASANIGEVEVTFIG